MGRKYIQGKNNFNEWFEIHLLNKNLYESFNYKGVELLNLLNFDIAFIYRQIYLDKNFHLIFKNKIPGIDKISESPSGKYSAYAKKMDMIQDYISKNWTYNLLQGVLNQEQIEEFNHNLKKICERFAKEQTEIYIKSKIKEYWSNERDFIKYIEEKDKDIYKIIIETIPGIVGFLKAKYNKAYKAWLKENGKNEFGLINKDVSMHLNKIISQKEIWDWSFLYEWENSTTNGIKKHQEWANSRLYKEIQPIEWNIYDYLFSNQGFDKSIKRPLLKSKNIIELWTGWAPKLQQRLETLTGSTEERNDNKGFKSFIKEKESITLVDINSNWFSEIKNKLIKATETYNIEWVEANFFHNGSFYKLKSPIYFMFWWTIWNFTHDEIRQILRNMQPQKALETSYFYFTYFHEPKWDKNSKEYIDTINKIKAMYGDSHDNPFYDHSTREKKSDFILSWLEALWIPRSKINYCVEYEESDKNHPARIKLWAEAISSIRIIDPVNKWVIFELGKWEKIRAIQSSRFSLDKLEQLANSNGYEIVEQWDYNWIGVCVFKSKMGIQNNYKKIKEKSLAAFSLSKKRGFDQNHFTKNSIQKRKRLTEGQLDAHLKQLAYRIIQINNNLTTRNDLIIRLVTKSSQRNTLGYYLKENDKFTTSDHQIIFIIMDEIQYWRNYNDKYLVMLENMIEEIEKNS